MIVLHQIAAALYLAAGIGALLGVTLPAPRILLGSVWGLAAGAAVHGLAFASLHRVDPTPSLTDLPLALSLVAWMAVLFLLVLRTRVRLPGFVAVMGPLAFVAAFAGALRLEAATHSVAAHSGGLPHAHVLLGGAGLALLGIAGLAGLFFLGEHRRLKAKRPTAQRFKLPSLEALDRVNVVALSLGFPLLSLGVVTGMLWLQTEYGSPWLGTSHETWNFVAWAIYAGLVLARFAGHQGARQAAASAVAGFAFLLFAIVGVGVLT